MVARAGVRSRAGRSGAKAPSEVARLRSERAETPRRVATGRRAEGKARGVASHDRVVEIQRASGLQGIAMQFSAGFDGQDSGVLGIMVLHLCKIGRAFIPARCLQYTRLGQTEQQLRSALNS